MTAALATVNQNVSLTVGFTAEQVDLIKRTVAKGTSDDELALFLQVAQRTGLDPFTRQIYAIMRWDSKANRSVMSIQVGIDGMRSTADRTEAYAPGSETVYEYRNDKLHKATAFVKKFSHGVWHEVSESAYFSEYAQGSPMWQKLPHVMLAKCAEARALRRAFPQQLGGIYAKEEMGRSEDVEEAEVTQADAAPAPPKALPPHPAVAMAQATFEGAMVATPAPSFEELNDRLHKLPGYAGDEGKAARKEWWAGALGYVKPGPKWSPFTPYSKADDATKARVLAELAKLEESAKGEDDVPEFHREPGVGR